MTIPSGDSELDPAARDAARKAKAGCARLRVALLRYGAKHGLPNLTRAQCLAALLGVKRKVPRPRRLAAPSGRDGVAGQGSKRPRAAGRGEGGVHGTRG